MLRILATFALAPLALALLGQPAQARPSTSSPSTVFDVSGLETGEPPAIAFAEQTALGRWTINAAGGKTKLRGGLHDFAPIGSGFVVQTGGSGLATTRWISAEGTPGPRSWRGRPGLGVSAGGEAVAFTGPKGRVRVIDSDGDRVVRMPRVPAGINTTAAGVSGEDCKEDATSNGCTVFVNSQARPVSWLTTSHGIVDTTPFRQVSTVRGRWLGGITKVTDTGTCSVMRRNARMQWRTCRNRFSDIAPDNARVLGIPAYGDGLGPTRLDLLDLRDGKQVRSWVPDRWATTAVYFDEVWEDPEHVLVVTLQDNRWAIVRLGLDGSMEYAVPPRRGTDEISPPLKLAVR